MNISTKQYIRSQSSSSNERNNSKQYQYSLIEKIDHLFQLASPSSTESWQAVANIKGKSLADSVSLLNARQVGLDKFIVLQMLSQKAAWPVQVHLFKSIPIAYKDAHHYNKFINAAGKNDNFPAAEAAFDEAKQKGLADHITYNIFIDALVMNIQIAKAEKILEEGNINAKYKANPHLIIDLHDLSHGAGFLVLKKNIEHLPFTMITGKGLHGKLPFMAFSQELKKQIQRYYGNSIECLTSQNLGCIKFTRKGRIDHSAEPTADLKLAPTTTTTTQTTAIHNRNSQASDSSTTPAICTASNPSEGYVKRKEGSTKIVEFSSLSQEIAISFLNQNMHLAPFTIMVPQELSNQYKYLSFKDAIVHFVNRSQTHLAKIDPNSKGRIQITEK